MPFHDTLGLCQKSLPSAWLACPKGSQLKRSKACEVPNSVDSFLCKGTAGLCRQLLENLQFGNRSVHWAGGEKKHQST